MKTLLPALALLLAPALAAAIPTPVPRPGDTVFVNDPGGFGVGTGTQMEDGSVMGPLCPPDICGGGDAAAFNAAEQLPPPGQKWASPSCTRIPCRLEEDPGDPRLSDAGEQPVTLDEIVVTAPRKDKGRPDKGLPDGAIVSADANGVKVDGRKVSPEELARMLAAERALERDRNKGFTPDGGFRGDGTTRGGLATVTPDIDPPGSSARVAGQLLGGSSLFGFDDTGAGTGPSSSKAPNVAQGAYGDIVQVDTTWASVTESKGGLKQLADDTKAPISFLEKVAGAGPNGVSAGNTSADDGTVGCSPGAGGDMTPCLGVTRQ